MNLHKQELILSLAAQGRKYSPTAAEVVRHVYLNAFAQVSAGEGGRVGGREWGGVAGPCGWEWEGVGVAVAVWEGVGGIGWEWGGGMAGQCGWEWAV